jgi:transcriptional regulator with GAF, ATPase, and Fis domain
MLMKRERVIAALEQSGWVQAKAARLVDMTPRHNSLSYTNSKYQDETDLIYFKNR